MTVQQQIQEYISTLPETKRLDMETLHRIITEAAPPCRLWFFDGKDETGKTVSNPNVGYGAYLMSYANGKTREFYRVGLSASTTGISVYIMGIADKKYLAQTFGEPLGKATVSGYCIKFKSLKDINVEVLLAAVKFGFTHSK